MRLSVKIFCGAVIAACAVAIAAALKSEPKNQQYALAAVVRDVNVNTDTVYASDGAGNLWAFRGAEDWLVGDLAGLLMDDRGTPEIADDVILSARYSGAAY